jgi:hypothetical protein
MEVSHWMLIYNTSTDVFKFKFYHLLFKCWILFRAVLVSMDGSLYLTVPYIHRLGSIIPILQHVQFGRFGLSLGILILSIWWLKQEFVTEFPTSPASGNFYTKHKIVLFQKIEVWISGRSVQTYDQCLICKCNNKFIKEIKWNTELKNSSCKALTSKCDLDLGGRGADVMHDISSYNCNYSWLSVTRYPRDWAFYFERNEIRVTWICHHYVDIRTCIYMCLIECTKK